jgi:hypothetical protein
MSDSDSPIIFASCLGVWFLVIVVIGLIVIGAVFGGIHYSVDGHAHLLKLGS